MSDVVLCLLDMLSLILSGDQTTGCQSTPKTYRTKVQYPTYLGFGSLRPLYVDGRSKMKRACRFLITSLAMTTMISVSLAQDVAFDPEDVQLGKAEYSPYLDQGYPDRVYFGDTHAHTSSEQIVLDAAAAYWPGGVGSPLNFFGCVWHRV